jgi:hemolysin activation/secretion protein
MPFAVLASGILFTHLATLPVHPVHAPPTVIGDRPIAQAVSDDTAVSDPCQIDSVFSTENTDLETPVPSIRSIQLTNNTVFEAEEVARFTQAFIGQPAQDDVLEQLQLCITQQYLSRGYLSSQVGGYDEDNGIVTVIAQEGLLNQIYINGIPTIADAPIPPSNVLPTDAADLTDNDPEEDPPLRIDLDYIRDRILRGGLYNEPLNANRLEDRLRVLGEETLFSNVEASLRAPEREQNAEPEPEPDSGQAEPGQENIENNSEDQPESNVTDLYVRVTEAPPIEIDSSVDNYSPNSVGSERINARLTYYNLTGAGDIFSLFGSHTIEGGASAIGAVYQVPANPMNGTLQLSAIFDRNRILTEPFEDLGIRGESESFAIQFRQPVILRYREELALSAGFSYKNGQTFLFNDIPTPFGIGPDEEGNSRTSVLRFGQEYTRRDLDGAWNLRSQFNLGTDWLDATTNPEPIPDSQFISWLGQIQRAQNLGQNHLLLIQAEIQLTPDSLLPAEQFVIGGGESVRGFRQNARSGDNGFRFAIEDQITLTRNAAGTPELRLTPFIEMGNVWNHPDNPNTLPDQNFLISAGLGLSLVLQSGFYARVNYAVPFVDLSDRDNNIQDDGITFQLGINRRF